MLVVLCPTRNRDKNQAVYNVFVKEIYLKSFAGWIFKIVYSLVRWNEEIQSWNMSKKAIDEASDSYEDNDTSGM